MSKSKRSKPKLPDKARARPARPAPDLDPVISVHPDTVDIDDSWEEVEAPPPPRRPRELMPTLSDEDPLRHDLVDEGSRPTLLDPDPLSHDVEPEDCTHPRTSRDCTSTRAIAAPARGHCRIVTVFVAAFVAHRPRIP